LAYTAILSRQRCYLHNAIVKATLQHMPIRSMKRELASAAACGVAVSFAASVHAAIPAGYMGKPFDPAIAGGPKCPPTVKAGPYAIPGRLDFVNYDLGGDGVAYHTGDHLIKGGAGYRIDTPTATLSLTSVCIPNVGGAGPCQNVWYDTSPTLDGTVYPTPTTADFSIGAVQVGDWVNLTVNVETTGTYSLSSTWATGNGPPGGEGGNGYMGLAVFSNGTMLASWSATFPNYNMYADFHHWKAYPNFATVTLTAGPQVIKMQSLAKHLQLDYVQFSLVTADGGLDNGDASIIGSPGADAAPPLGDAGGSSGMTGSSGAAAASGSITGGMTTGTTGGSGTAGSGVTASGSSATTPPPAGGSGATSGSSSGTVGSSAGATSAGASSSGSAAASNPSSGSGCSLTAAAPGRTMPAGALVLLASVAASLARRRTRSTASKTS
jgi:hypothetical protein